jgi:hypothetical protein
MARVCIAVLVVALAFAGSSFMPNEVGSEPNPPVWPDSVKVIDPADPSAG